MNLLPTLCFLTILSFAMACFAFQNIEILDFDDFGIDLYPALGTTLSGSDLDDDKKTCVFDFTPNIGTARYKCYLFLFSDLDS